jgi:predicted hydrocarbon binding protein
MTILYIIIGRKMDIDEIKKKVVKSTFEEVGARIGRLVLEKNKKYGNSFSKSGGMLRILYPDGIKPDQYDELLTVTRILDKLFRIATDKDAFGESPWKDIAGYSILKLAALDNEKPK